MDKEEVILSNDDSTENLDGVKRPKRLATTKIRDALDRIGLSLGKPITDKLDTSLLGSIRSSSLLSKSNIPSLLDSYKSTLGATLSRGISLSPLLNPRQPQQQPPPPIAPSPQAPDHVLCGPVYAPAAPVIPNAPSTVPSVAPSIAPSVQMNMKTPAIPEQVNAETVGDAKPVVLPDYLMDKDGKKPKNKTSTDKITAKQLKEAAALRNEINFAVRHHIYKHSSSEVKNMNQKHAQEKNTQNDDPPNDDPPNENPPMTEAPPYYAPPTTQAPSFYPPPTPGYQNFNFFSDFWQNLIGRKSPIKTLFRSGEPSVGSARSDFSYVSDAKGLDPSPQEYASNSYSDIEDESEVYDEDEAVEKMMSKMAARVMKEGIVSNTVESYVNNEETPSSELSQSREELNITSIIEDMNFNIGESVIGWRTLQRNQRESHALIGMTNSSILLVQEKNGIYTLKSEELLLSKPTFFAAFTFWNQTQRSIDGIVIVSIQHEIVFYRINEKMDKMEFIWMWPTNKHVRYIHHFVVDNSDTLLVMTDTLGGSSANLYRFDMNQREFFLRESLSLKSRARNSALIQMGHDTLLCFPQDGHAAIYKYENHHFKYFTEIETDEADILSAFEMGGYSYLAIGGHHPKILRYFHGQFINQTILDNSWGFVEFFLPVPARTYRDDLILFIQHRMDYGSHTHSFLEALIWNGDAFHPALSVPCYVGDGTSDLGMGCMLDQDRELGVIGATTFQRNRTISIIVPRHEAPSGLFGLQIDLLPAVSTINDHLLEQLSEVMILLGVRDEVLKNARDLIDSFPKDPVEEITVKDRDIDLVYTEHLDLGSIIPVQGIFFDDEPITADQVDHFYGLLDEAETLLKELETLDRTKREDTIKSLHLQSLNVTELHVNYINDIPAEDFIFIEDGHLTIPGTVVAESVEANSVERIPDAMNQRLQQQPPPETIVVDDLNFDVINGIKWKDLMNQIVYKHLPIYLDELVVGGVSSTKIVYQDLFETCEKILTIPIVIADCVREECNLNAKFE